MVLFKLSDRFENTLPKIYMNMFCCRGRGVDLHILRTENKKSGIVFIIIIVFIIFDIRISSFKYKEPLDRF